jgi:hypothetical protein
MTAPAPAARHHYGPRSPWVLPEDGIIDPIAVELAATGTRRVALTPGERLAAAARILATGGTPYVISRRLGCNCRAGHALAAAVTSDRAALLEATPAGQWACQRCGAAYFGTPPERGLCPGCQAADHRRAA